MISNFTHIFMSYDAYEDWNRNEAQEGLLEVELDHFTGSPPVMERLLTKGAYGEDESMTKGL
jgi:hypothetical protein